MTRYGFILGCLLIIGCLLVAGGCADPRTQGESTNAEPAERRTVFDPLVQTLDRAEGVQQTLDEREAEQRRRIEQDQQ